MNLLHQLKSLPKSNLIFIALWVLTMISLPIVGWTWGEAALIRGMSVGVLMQGIAVLAILASAWGWRKTITSFAIVGVLSYFAEFIGSKTGFPFGAYHYTDVLQPQLGGVPLLIPLAWMMMLPPPGLWHGSSFQIPIPDSRCTNLPFSIPLFPPSPSPPGTYSSTRKWSAGDFGSGKFQVNISAFPLVNYFGWLLVSAC
jgi:hypothetical protein